MEVSRELLFFFSAIGAFNGLVLGSYFMFLSRQKHISNRFLGFLLIMLSIRIGKSVFFYFNDSLSYYFIQLGLTACALIGPSVYFYLKSIKYPQAKVRREWPFHMFPIIAVLTIIGYFYNFRDYLEYWQEYIIPGIYYEWLIYLLIGGYILRKSFKDLFAKGHKMSDFDTWVLSLYLGNVIIWIAYKTFFYTSYIVGAISFSFIFYLLILFLVINRKSGSIFYDKQKKYGDKKIDPKEAELLMQKLDELMTVKELFKNPSLKLPDVAKELNVLPHRISQLLNDNMKKGFPLYVNEFRIQAAKELIKQNEHFTLEGIGQECGFKSNSTFYTTFKKLTGLTPAKYKNS